MLALQDFAAKLFLTVVTSASASTSHHPGLGVLANGAQPGVAGLAVHEHNADGWVYHHVFHVIDSNVTVHFPASNESVRSADDVALTGTQRELEIQIPGF